MVIFHLIECVILQNKGIIIGPLSGFFLMSELLSTQPLGSMSPRSVVGLRGTEAARWPVSYCIGKCLSWWKRPGRGDTLLTHKLHTLTLTYHPCAIYSPTLTAMLYWHPDEIESMGRGPPGDGDRSHSCDLQHYNTSISDSLSLIRKNNEKITVVVTAVSMGSVGCENTVLPAEM